MRIYPLFLISFVFISCASTKFGELGDSSVGLAASKKNFLDWQKINGKATKDYFCKKKTPIRKISHTVSLVIPGPRDGSSIEEHQQRRQLFLDKARETFKSFYYVISRKASSYYRSHDPTNGFGGLFYYSHNYFEDKNYRFDWSSGRTVVYVFNPDTHTTFAVDHHLSGAHNNIVSMELSSIVRDFTVLMSSDIWYQRLPNSGKDSNQFDAKTGMMSVSYAMQSNDYIWSKLLPTMTIIKETSVDKDKIIFDLELDLHLFCQYAVSMDDLLAR